MVQANRMRVRGFCGGSTQAAGRHAVASPTPPRSELACFAAEYLGNNGRVYCMTFENT